MIPRALGTPRRIRAAAAASLACALLLLAAPGASADLLSPESGGSPNANAIDTLYWIVFLMGMVIFVLVEGLLIYSLVKYRFKRDAPEPAQIRGNTRLEIGWTGAAIVLVVIISVITFLGLPSIRTPAASGPDTETNNGVLFAANDQPPAPDGKAVTIDVTGQQYLWRYDYPERGVYSYYEMVVPVDTTVILRITSQDVQHSWWIPQLGGKFDAYPGHVNETWFKTPRVGVYEGQCAELCGENHAQMYAKVRSVSAPEYRAFIARQQAAIRSAQEQLARSRQEEAEAASAQGGQPSDG
jgi:cytochrome c oxidase subunit 2